MTHLPHPMMIDDLPLLQKKLLNATGSLGNKWQHFRTLAKHQSDIFPTYSAFEALVTGEEEAAFRFRRFFEQQINVLPASCRGLTMQHHTWCSANPLARWAIAYDWVADRSAFSDFDHDRAADSLIDATYSFIYPLVFAREPIADNQIASMLFACGVVGYLFGVKRGQDARAQAMYQTALERCHTIVEKAEAQFVGEGSRYMMGVNAMAMGSWLAFLKWLDQPYDASRWLSCQVSARQLAGPGGVALGWDADGLFRPFGMAGLALLARESSDESALAVIDYFNMWQGVDFGAWLADQRIWTLLWWPDDASENPLSMTPKEKLFPGWMHPEIGGAIDINASKLRVAQLWDPCTGDFAGGISRWHTDPNTLHLEIGGVPLSLDGKPSKGCTAFDFLPEDFLNADELQAIKCDLKMQAAVRGKVDFSIAERLRAFAHGTIGGSNALVLNHEPWYYPRKKVHGKGTLWAQLPGISAMAADVTGYYTPRYPVERVERTTMVLDDHLVLVLDNIDSREPVDVMWQMYVRPEQVTKEVDRVQIVTPQGPNLDILTSESNTLDIQQIDGYPDKPCGGSVRVSWSQRIGHGTMATALVPSDDQIVGVNESAWSGSLIDWNENLLKGELPNNLSKQMLTKKTLKDVVDTLSKAPPTQWRLLTADLIVPADANYLRLVVVNPSAGIWLNGRCIKFPSDQIYPNTDWGDILPTLVEVEAGKNKLSLVMRPLQGYLQADAGTWYQRTPRPAVKFQAHLDCWTLTTAEHRYSVLSRSAARLAGWQTDARWLILKDDALYGALDVTSIISPNKTQPCLATNKPVHAVCHKGKWHQQKTTLPTDPPTYLCQSKLSTQQSSKPRAKVDTPGWEVANTLTLTDCDVLETCLDNVDWRVQCAAVSRLAELKPANICETLRKLLSVELDTGSLMPTFQETKITTWTQDMLALGREQNTKSYRLAHALLRALTTLKDIHAAPLARQALNNLAHFYPIHHAAINLLSTLKLDNDRSLFEHWSQHPEYNTQQAAKRALERLSTNKPFGSHGFSLVALNRGAWALNMNQKTVATVTASGMVDWLLPDPQSEGPLITELKKETHLGLIHGVKFNLHFPQLCEQMTKLTATVSDDGQCAFFVGESQSKKGHWIGTHKAVIALDSMTNRWHWQIEASLTAQQENSTPTTIEYNNILPQMTGERLLGSPWKKFTCTLLETPEHNYWKVPHQHVHHTSVQVDQKQFAIGGLAGFFGEDLNPVVTIEATDGTPHWAICDAYYDLHCLVKPNTPMKANDTLVIKHRIHFLDRETGRNCLTKAKCLPKTKMPTIIPLNLGANDLSQPMTVSQSNEAAGFRVNPSLNQNWNSNGGPKGQGCLTLINEGANTENIWVACGNSQLQPGRSVRLDGKVLLKGAAQGKVYLRLRPHYYQAHPTPHVQYLEIFCSIPAEQITGDWEPISTPQFVAPWDIPDMEIEIAIVFCGIGIAHVADLHVQLNNKNELHFPVGHHYKKHLATSKLNHLENLNAI